MKFAIMRIAIGTMANVFVLRVALLSYFIMTDATNNATM